MWRPEKQTQRNKTKAPVGVGFPFHHLCPGIQLQAQHRCSSLPLCWCGSRLCMPMGGAPATVHAYGWCSSDVIETIQGCLCFPSPSALSVPCSAVLVFNCTSSSSSCHERYLITLRHQNLSFHSVHPFFFSPSSKPFSGPGTTVSTLRTAT